MNPMRDINRHQAGCENKVHSGRDKKESFINCGNTGWFGDVVTCSECDKKYIEKYVNGTPYYYEEDYDDDIL